MVMITHRSRESGAVSLFLVIFAMLLITIVTISFVRLMVTDQQQATTNDLSQSAYDSALAGAEDAKRALIWYRTTCANGGDCAGAEATINSATCNEGLSEVITVPGDNGEVLVQQQQSANDSKLNQAYTCVKMQLETDDYIGALSPNSSKLIPLKSTDPFTTVTIEWYNRDDLGGATTTVDLLSNVQAQANQPLYQQTDWPVTRPSLLRTQLIQFGSSFTLADFDTSSPAESNANTLFLYPSGSTGSTVPVEDTWNIAAEDIRRTPTGEPQPTRCIGDLIGGGYACTVNITLPNPVGGDANNRTAYLRLSTLYNGAHFRVSLDGTQFDGVQPSIDSTGRANDLFRRVETRVDLVDTNFPFPEAAVDLTGNLCKDFLVTDRASDFVNSCTP